MKLLPKLKQDEEKERYILAAFIGWQMGAGGDKKFGDYLAELGLTEKQSPGIIEGTKITKEQAIKKAEEILAMAREKRKTA